MSDFQRERQPLVIREDVVNSLHLDEITYVQAIALKSKAYFDIIKNIEEYGKYPEVFRERDIENIDRLIAQLEEIKASIA